MYGHEHLPDVPTMAHHHHDGHYIHICATTEMQKRQYVDCRLSTIQENVTKRSYNKPRPRASPRRRAPSFSSSHTLRDNPPVHRGVSAATTTQVAGHLLDQTANNTHLTTGSRAYVYMRPGSGLLFLVTTLLACCDEA